MNIALGAAKALERLHLQVNPSIIHRDQTTFYYAWILSQRFLILGLLKLPQLGAQDLDRWEHLDIWHQRLPFVNPCQSGQIFTVLGLCSWSSLLDGKPWIVRDKTKNSI